MEAGLSCTGYTYPPSDRERMVALPDRLHGQDEVSVAMKRDALEGCE